MLYLPKNKTLNKKAAALMATAYNTDFQSPVNSQIFITGHLFFTYGGVMLKQSSSPN